MKLIAVLALAASLFATSVFAQDSMSEANAGSNAQIDATQQAAAVVTFNAPAVPSDTTIRTVGQQTAPSMSSGHPCLLPTSLGIGIIGAGASFGTGQVDDACMLAQMGERDAALYMIAARSPEACRALVASGDISPASSCGGTIETQPTAAASTGIECVRDASGRVTEIRVAPGTDPAAARAFCG